MLVRATLSPSCELRHPLYHCITPWVSMPNYSTIHSSKDVSSPKTPDQTRQKKEKEKEKEWVLERRIRRGGRGRERENHRHTKQELSIHVRDALRQVDITRHCIPIDIQEPGAQDGNALITLEGEGDFLGALGEVYSIPLEASCYCSGCFFTPPQKRGHGSIWSAGDRKQKSSCHWEVNLLISKVYRTEWLADWDANLILVRSGPVRSRHGDNRITG